MHAYPGLYNASDLPPEALTGLLLNIPVIEADHDIRNIHAIGAAFSDKDDKYLKHLIEMTFDHDPKRVKKALDLIAITQGARGNPQNKAS